MKAPKVSKTEKANFYKSLFFETLDDSIRHIIISLLVIFAVVFLICGI